MKQGTAKKGTGRIIPAPVVNRKNPVPDQDSKASRIPAPPWKRKRGKSAVAAFSFFLLVVLPTLLVSFYYLFIAADQYMVETRFAVRNATSAGTSSVLEGLGLGLSGASASDTYIIREYTHSREILKRIDARIDLRARYTKPAQDFYASLPVDASFEDFLEYWRTMVTVDLDRTSHILTIRSYAFSAEDARDIAAAILQESERMINDLTEQARKDAVAYAENEVRKAEERLRKIRTEFLKFRSNTQQIDPAKQAQVQVALIGKLEEQLAQMRAKLSEALNYLSEDAPTVVFLKNRIRALRQQIADERRKLGVKGTLPRTAAGSKRTQSASVAKMPSGVPLSTVLSEYEAMLVEREFAQKFYLSALSGLEQARLLANRQQRYLATFVRPYLPDEAQYPKALRNTIFVFLSLTLLWSLTFLMIQSVRDRL